ncbi:MAG: hypothetical protein Q4Q21_06910 [Lachnospiraceae bacterium]|nr:hypothetical protein [Lachnospiraceae bacterium]
MMRSDKRGSVNPGLLKAGGVVLAVLIVGATGVVLYHDRQTQAAYQEWARAENKKVFDQATQQRLSDQQLLSLERQLNDSFYQRLQDQLPVRVLVVGDGYGAGMGASQVARSWAQRLKASLAMKYGVTVELTNVSLSEQNGGFGAWAALRQQPDGAATAMLAEMVGDGRAEVSKDGTISAEGWNNTMSHAFRKDEYDLAIVSLGMTDDPSQFPTWYEAVLRGLREKYRQCSVISLLSSQALTSPELGFADENTEALRTISNQYHADVVNVGMEMLDPEGAEKEATTSEIAQKAVAMAAGSGAAGAGAAATGEAGDADEQVKAAQAAIQKYTVEGLYLNDAGQGFLADTLQKFIDQKVANAQGYTAGEVTLLDPAVEALDEFHYIPVTELNRLNDYTYALGKNQMRLADDSADDAALDGADGGTVTGGAADTTGAGAGSGADGTGDAGATDSTGAAGVGAAGAAGGRKSGSIVRHSEHVAGDFFRGIVGVDYMLASGDNDLYIATGDGTKPFGRITANNPYSSSTRSVVPVNDHFSADRDGNLIISFGTKEQAAGLQGLIFGGDLELPTALDDFKTVAYVGPTDESGKRLPLDEDGRIAETTAETAPETMKAAKKPGTAGQAGAANLAGGAAGNAQAGAAQSTNGSGTDRTKGSKTSDGTDKPKSEQAADKNHSAASTGTETTGAQDGTPKSSTHTGDGNTRESAASSEAGTTASSTAAESTTEADKPHGTIPGVIEIPADGPRETSEGKHVLTEEERLAILDRMKTSEAANG